MLTGVSLLVRTLTPSPSSSRVRTPDRALPAQDLELRPLTALSVAAALPGRDMLAALLGSRRDTSARDGRRRGSRRRPVAGGGVGVRRLPARGRPARTASRLRDNPLRPGPASEAAVGPRGARTGDAGPARACRATRGRDVRLRPRREHGHRPGDERGRTPATALADGRPAPIQFWYWAGTTTLDPQNAFGRVTRRDPPPDTPGVASVRLDTLGRLTGLEVVPPRAGGEPPSAPLDWAAPPGRRGPRPHASPVSASRCRPAALRRRPRRLGGHNTRAAAPARLSRGGRAPWSPGVAGAARGGAGGPPTGGVQFGEEAYWNHAATLFWVVLPVGLVLAVRNLRLGRGGPRGRSAWPWSSSPPSAWPGYCRARLTTQPFTQMVRCAQRDTPSSAARRWRSSTWPPSRRFAAAGRSCSSRGAAPGGPLARPYPRVGRDILVGLV